MGEEDHVSTYVDHRCKAPRTWSPSLDGAGWAAAGLGAQSLRNGKRKSGRLRQQVTQAHSASVTPRQDRPGGRARIWG